MNVVDRIWSRGYKNIGKATLDRVDQSIPKAFGHMEKMEKEKERPTISEDAWGHGEGMD